MVKVKETETLFLFNASSPWRIYAIGRFRPFMVYFDGKWRLWWAAMERLSDCEILSEFDWQCTKAIRTTPL